MNFTKSKYQQDIENVVLKTDKNILVNAKAGSGKSTTLKMIAKTIDPKLKTAFVAFNKKIVEELREDLPKNIECTTLHSKGFQIVRGSLVNSKKCVLNNYKINDLIKDASKSWGLEEMFDDKQEQRSYCDRVRELCNLARLFLTKNNEELELVAEKYDILISNGEVSKCFKILKTAGQMRTKIDFTDMIYHAVRYGKLTEIQKYDVIFIDECQDLNKCQLALVRKLLKKDGRFIAVGDPAQSIYGFAGADKKSFQSFMDIENTIEMPLNECYRCGKNIIKYAQNIVPEIEAFSGNEDGEVDLAASLDMIKANDFVMCRNTLPLIETFYILIKKQIPAFIVGKDIGENICKIIKDTKRIGLDPLFNELDKQLEKVALKLAKKFPDLNESEVKQKFAYINFKEVVAILEMMRSADKTIKNAEDLRSRVVEMFAQKEDSVMLSSIHRAKGLEADRCFIIRPDLMPSKYAKQPWEKIQEKNLEYVAYTRAKKYLGIVY